MDVNRKLDYVFFTVREFAYTSYAAVVNDLTSMLIEACPKDKRICVINFDHNNDEDENNNVGVFHEHVQLEYTTIKPDADRSSIQTAIVIGLVENPEDKWCLIVDIPVTKNHFEYDFWIEKDEDNDFDPNTAYRFGGTFGSNGVPENMNEYQAYKYYKKRIYMTIHRIIENAHVAIRTDPDDPDAFVYR